jgi:hypothetical protein
MNQVLESLQCLAIWVSFEAICLARFWKGAGKPDSQSARQHVTLKWRGSANNSRVLRTDSRLAEMSKKVPVKVPVNV